MRESIYKLQDNFRSSCWIYIFVRRKSAQKDIGEWRKIEDDGKKRRRLTSGYSKGRSFHFLISSARTIVIKSYSCHNAKIKF